jgi:hypothetical protein
MAALSGQRKPAPVKKVPAPLGVAIPPFVLALVGAGLLAAGLRLEGALLLALGLIVLFVGVAAWSSRLHQGLEPPASQGAGRREQIVVEWPDWLKRFAKYWILAALVLGVLALIALLVSALR